MDIVHLMLLYMSLLFASNVTPTTVPGIENFVVKDGVFTTMAPMDSFLLEESAGGRFEIIEDISGDVENDSTPSEDIGPMVTPSPTLTITLSPSPTLSPTPKITPKATTSLAPTISLSPAPTEAPTVTPNPTSSPTPFPTITPNPTYKTLKKGDKGSEVLEMQTRLKELGYYSGQLDGHFGNATYSAVFRFQRLNKLWGDGIAGIRTLTMLYESPYVVDADGLLYEN